MLFVQHPARPGFSFEGKRRTNDCFRKPKPMEEHKWKERKWDMKILTGLEVGHVLLTPEAFVLIFSSGNVAEAVVLPASVFWEVSH